LKSQGPSIIYISHFIEEVKQLADKITVLRDGKSVAASPAPDLDTDKIIELMIGRTVDDLYPHSHRSPGDAVLEIKNLRGLTKPVDASLTLRRGEVLGIAGLVGTGRTELLRSIFGLDKIKTGSIRIGVYGGPASPADRWSQGIGLLSENRKEEGLALNLSIAENVTLSKLGILGRLGFISPSRQAEAVKNWISCLEIKCLGPWQKASDLSGGNQQKVAFARLLQHDVDILLLDEPTRGIDVAAKAAIYKIIDDLACGCEKSLRPPKAVIVVSSYLPELMGICDRIAVMCRGVLGPARPVNQVAEHMLMLEAVGKGAK
jgi:ribose transport system ATP-binding protein